MGVTYLARLGPQLRPAKRFRRAAARRGKLFTFGKTLDLLPCGLIGIVASLFPDIDATGAQCEPFVVIEPSMNGLEKTRLYGMEYTGSGGVKGGGM